LLQAAPSPRVSIGAFKGVENGDGFRRPPMWVVARAIPRAVGALRGLRRPENCRADAEVMERLQQEL